MIRKLLDWAVSNPLIVMILTTGLIIGGGYAFTHVNIEAYPDPTPPIIDVVAQFPGASAGQVERQVTIPLEVALAGMPGLDTTRSQSLFGLAQLRNQFTYATDYWQARQEVLNRLGSVTLPAGVEAGISPASPIGEVLRFTLENPKDPETGKPVYTLNDLQSVEDFIVERELRRVPGVAGVSGVGGTVKRYEIQPDPNRLRHYGIKLEQLEQALDRANANGSGDNLVQGEQTSVVRSLGQFGLGHDPQQLVLGLQDPVEAAKVLRAEEARRCLEIRQVVLATVNNVPVRVDQVVDGGPVLNADGTSRVDDATLASRGVIVGQKTRLGLAAISYPRTGADGKPLTTADGATVWQDEEDVVQGIVLLYKGEKSLPALKGVLAKIDELHASGKLLPGIKIVPYYDRTTLIDRTTVTVHENLVVGMALVTAILIMFLGNVRAAVIAAINIPLALLFAFGVLFLRGKSANLLSIGAVDFGIIVDSTVIIVESVYRGLTHDDAHGLTLAQRITKSAGAVQRSLVYATAVMVCALLPLFTMTGPEGQIFGPMADTYAFAIGGALVLSLTVSPVLCFLILRNVKPKPDNFVVRSIDWLYRVQLQGLLATRWLVAAGFLAAVVATGATAATMGREFMPELEEGGLLVRGTFPVNISFDEVVRHGTEFRRFIQSFSEIRVIPTTVGRPNDGMDTGGYYLLQANLPLRAQEEWPVDKTRGRRRTKKELIADITVGLEERFPGVPWDFSQIIRDNVLEALSGVKGENSIKIYGPDLDVLENTGMEVRDTLNMVAGVQNASVYRNQGQSNLEFYVDRQKCARWNVSAADVQSVIQSAVGGKAVTDMVEGEKTFDVTIRWPERLRADEQAILNIPIPVGNTLRADNQFAMGNTPISGASIGLTSTGNVMKLPSATGSSFNAPSLDFDVPSRRVGDLVTPLGENGLPDPKASFVRPGASTIYREQGDRLIAIKFEVRGRDLASGVAEARSKIEPMIHPPYRAEWSGEFQQMEAAERRLAGMFALSMILIALVIYLAFRSFLDAAVVLANILAMVIGGVWALKFAGLYFNISAAVGFISILGVAVMNGLLLVSTFNGMRAKGIDLRETLLEGTGKLVRPILMTALAAMLGLLPAALSTAMGSECQKPLAVVVVGGMISTILCLNLVPVLYSFYGKRTPPEGAGDFAH
ncbi:efflux RND transporter permease subunit [Planctomyces sp. SH-PL14]|uniref:efflux RND transporter permease subunit n=1 Tax=Planctomyces sp. SH-PL14 TaxID=1632864 RepID=UPI00078DBDDF|nr:efflux RND transporter permease subunit [Planctomyces sp. SH-PL14]AMV20522.1 Cobalt-zinc-cadmium resistance protein CzcA [Planctomyces sp. SH-PL14]